MGMGLEAPPVIRDKPRKGNWIWPTLAVIVALPFFALNVLVICLCSYLQVGSETKLLRNIALDTADVAPRQKFQGSVGPLTCGFARAALSFVNLPPEADAAGRTIKRAEFSFCKFDQAVSAEGRRAMIAKSEQAMTARGWERAVCVQNDDATVSVFVRQQPRSGLLRVAFVVLAGRELVVGSVSGDVQPLLDLAVERLPPITSPLRSPATA